MAAPSPKRKACEVVAVAEDYVACRLADGCLLAKRHTGLCAIPLPEGRRNQRAAPPPSPKQQQQQQQKAPVDEMERIGLKLTGVDLWAASV